MNKEAEFDTFKEDFQAIATSDAASAKFERIALRLLNETFLVQSNPRDKNDYENALTILPQLKDYFGLIGLEVVQEQYMRIVYLRSADGHNRRPLDKTTTVVLLTLRLLQFQRKNDTAWAESLVVTEQDILASIYEESKVYDKKSLNMTKFKAALAVLRRYKCIDYSGDLSMTSTPISVFETTRLLVTDTDLQALSNRLATYKNGGNEDEDLNQDSAD